MSIDLNDHQQPGASKESAPQGAPEVPCGGPLAETPTQAARSALLRRGYRELSSLLAAIEFRAEHGCFRQTLSVGLHVTSWPGKQGLVDLNVAVFSPVTPPARDDIEAQVRGVQYEHCLKLAQRRRSRHRAAACQRLGQLGRPEATEVLQAISREADQVVREAAAAALQRLEAPRFPPELFAGLELELVQHQPGGARVLAQARTNERGLAQFPGIPAGAQISLRFAHEAAHQLAFQVDEAKFLKFNASGPAQGTVGRYQLEIKPLPGSRKGFFDAVLHLKNDFPEAVEEGFRPVALLRNDIFQPVIEGKVARFNELPVGEYCVFLTETSRAQRGEIALQASSAGAVNEDLISLGAQLPIIVHPPDRRLLASVEADAAGRTLVTVQTDCPELGGARVRYRLGQESGELMLAQAAGTPAFRGVVCLRQAYSGERAPGLSLEVAEPGGGTGHDGEGRQPSAELVNPGSGPGNAGIRQEHFAEP